MKKTNEEVEEKLTKVRQATLSAVNEMQEQTDKQFEKLRFSMREMIETEGKVKSILKQIRFKISMMTLDNVKEVNDYISWAVNKIEKETEKVKQRMKEL